MTAPLLQSYVSAGFPSTADDKIESDLNLHEHVVSNPPATYFVRARGDSMEGAGIIDGDILVVDRSIQIKDGVIVVAHLDGEFTVKRLVKRGGQYLLVAENQKYNQCL